MKDMDPEMQEWIDLHKTDDTTRLRLRFHGNEGINQAIMQIECRRKTATRLPIVLANKAFMFPTSLSAEQATSESLAALHAEIAGYTRGSRHLDLTCGLAIDALEAARCGAIVTAVDIDPEIVRVANHNAAALGLDSNFRAINADSREFVTATTEQWDSVFIDPARRSDTGKKLTAITDCLPDVTQLLPYILDRAKKIIIKASPMLDITALAAELNHAVGCQGAVTRMIALGTAKECKEIVAVVQRDASGSYATEAITSLAFPAQPGRFRSYARPDTPPTITQLPTTGEYLYEPYPSVMKTAAWNNLAAIDQSLRQLHPNTHLFASPVHVTNFPGTVFLIEHVDSMTDKALRSIAKDYPQINVATRNFVISAPELAKRLRVKEGGNKQLFGTRVTTKGSLALIVCRRV